MNNNSIEDDTLMSKSSDKKTTFGLNEAQIGRLLQLGSDPAPALTDNQAGSKTPSSTSKNGSPLTSAESPQIEGYDILAKLGEAGQGQVWRALQLSTGREVALKVPRIGSIISDRIRMRFEREVELAARLKHPRIARLLDSGIHQGQYYYVMDLIEGTNLNQYVQNKNLSQTAILKLMVEICQAVQHAHQKGIIHRDLKPSNIIVTADEVPYLVDFGLAKEILHEDQAPDVSLDGETLGTPAYMSPEQAAGHVEQVDTRTDVYSLGVILFHLLTGQLPHDLSGSRYDVLKRIAEGEKKRPRRINSRLDKDLEVLLLKTLDREPDRRYASAGGLAQDIENYLTGAPLIAGPPTTRYRLKKFIRRHTSLVAAVMSVLIVLIAGIIVSSIFALREHHQAQRLITLVDFLTVDVLGSARQIKGRDATVIDLIDAATEKLDAGAFEDQPLTAESLIRFRLGNLIKDLGYPNKAIPHLERVAEIYLEQGITPPTKGRLYSGESPDLIMNYLALAYLRSGEIRKAESIFQTIIENKEKRNAIYTDLYPWVKSKVAEICRMQARYDQSERILLEMMDPQFRNGQGLPPRHMVECMCGLAETYRAQGRYDESEKMYLEAQDVMERHDVKAKDLHVSPPSMCLARLYLELGRYQKAEELCRGEIERFSRESPGQNRMGMIAVMNGLAVALTRKGDFDEAERLLAEVWKVRREIQGDNHPDTLTTINAFGVLRREQQRYDEAESLLRQALDGRQLKLGDDHAETLESKNDLAVLYREQGDYAKAEPLLLEALRGRRLKLGDAHPHTKESLENLIDLYQAWGKPEQAEQWKVKLSGS